MRHGFVVKEPMTNGKAIPSCFIVLYIMRIFLFSHSRSRTLIFSGALDTVGVG